MRSLLRSRKTSAAIVLALVGGVASAGIGASFLVACSGDDDSGTPTPSSDAGSDGSFVQPGADSSAPNDASLPPDATIVTTMPNASGDDASSDAAPGTQPDASDADVDAGADANVVFGSADFILDQKCDPDGPPADIGGFGFAMAKAPTSAGSCTTSAAGPNCTFSSCTTEPTQATETEVLGVNAGVVTMNEYLLDGGDSGPSPFATFVLNDAGRYSSRNGDPIFPTPNGGSVVLSGSGSSADGGVGSFTLTLPSPTVPMITLPGITLTGAPVCGAPEKGTIPLTHDLGLTWSSGAPGAELTVTVTVNEASDAGAGMDAGTITNMVSCTFDQAAQAASIPYTGGLALLAPAGATNVSGLIVFGNVSHAQVIADGGTPIRGAMTKYASPRAIQFTTP